MDAGGLTLVALVMLVGLVGVVVPVLPGLVLVWGAALVWALLEDGAVRWVVLAVVTALLVVGTVAKYVLAARSTRGSGAPTSTLLLGVAGAVVGFFVIPVVGLVVGGLAGLYLAELARLHDGPAAWRSTWSAVRALGVGVLVELGAGLAMVAVWAVGAALSA